MTREQASEVIAMTLDKIATQIMGAEMMDNETRQGLEHTIRAFTMARTALRGPEWVRTVDRLPTAEDAGIDGMVAFCYRDNWDCFNRLEKWSDISPQKYTYWHRMLKAPRSEE